MEQRLARDLLSAIVRTCMQSKMTFSTRGVHTGKRVPIDAEFDGESECTVESRLFWRLGRLFSSFLFFTFLSEGYWGLPETFLKVITAVSIPVESVRAQGVLTFFVFETRHRDPLFWYVDFFGVFLAYFGMWLGGILSDLCAYMWAHAKTRG